VEPSYEHFYIICKECCVESQFLIRITNQYDFGKLDSVETDEYLSRTQAAGEEVFTVSTEARKAKLITDGNSSNIYYLKAE